MHGRLRPLRRMRVEAPDGFWEMRRSCAPAQLAYSGSSSPEPPISFGKSFIFGRPSLMLSTFSP